MVRKVKVRNLRVMHKTRIEGALQTFTFSFRQLFNTMPPGGAMTTSTATCFSLGHRKIVEGLKNQKSKLGYFL